MSMILIELNKLSQWLVLKYPSYSVFVTVRGTEDYHRVLPFSILFSLQAHRHWRRLVDHHSAAQRGCLLATGQRIYPLVSNSARAIKWISHFTPVPPVLPSLHRENPSYPPSTQTRSTPTKESCIGETSFSYPVRDTLGQERRADAMVDKMHFTNSEVLSETAARTAPTAIFTIKRIRFSNRSPDSQALRGAPWDAGVAEKGSRADLDDVGSSLRGSVRAEVSVKALRTLSGRKGRGAKVNPSSVKRESSRFFSSKGEPPGRVMDGPGSSQRRLST
ncbi:hypothetical protein BKA70DRAFT_1393639 [Coprinopsis sp. MPI-PUGE-AT-0042]|nr:hypothetical protein BKA70DRAFT_1393639 [Coprinopsis sp. MPI-PUGE-AT-0042]